MEKIKQKIVIFHEALDSLENAIRIFDKYEDLYSKKQSQENEELFLGMRDSMIQRFEYCTDLFWKVIKIYLAEVEKIELPTYSPRGVIRAILKAKIISESDSKACMDMVISRNKTSHIYHEEIADDIAEHVPIYYKVFAKILAQLEQNIAEK